ncbi:hypothetical protein SE92_31370 [Bradyrhizobium sp. AT1]|nr:hypothetical protein SE92_31370 [Bradyrhizobium sp. AT1]
MRRRSSRVGPKLDEACGIVDLPIRRVARPDAANQVRSRGTGLFAAMAERILMKVVTAGAGVRCRWVMRPNSMSIGAGFITRWASSRLRQ